MRKEDSASSEDGKEGKEITEENEQERPRDARLSDVELPKIEGAW